METTGHALELVGFIAILISVAYLIIRLTYTLIVGRKARLRFGMEALFALTILYYAVEPGIGWAGFHDHIADIKAAVAFLWWLSLAFTIDSLLTIYAWDGILSEAGERRTPQLITGGVSLLLYGTAILVVLHFFYDKPIGTLLATSGALAVVLGFSAQSTLKEVFAGISLNATKAVRKGDWLEVAGVYGQVYEIDWRSISLKNPHTDSLYVFPNSAVAGQTILNFSEPTGRFKYFFNFYIEPSAPPEKVIRAILEELRYSRHVYRDPAPDFNILGFSDVGMEIRMRFFFAGHDPWWDAQNEACMAIWAAMKKHNFRLSLKRAHLGSEDEWPLLEKQVSSIYNPDVIRASLACNAAFAGFTENDLQRLADAAKILALNPPSYFYEPQVVDDHFYLVLEGKTGIYTPHGDHEVAIEECSTGDVFGITDVTEEHPRKNLAQAIEFSCVAKFPLSLLREMLLANSGATEVMAGAVSAKTMARDEFREQKLAVLRLQQHQRDQHHLSRQLRKSVDNLLQRSWFHHVKFHAGSRHADQDFIEALMAGAALVCSAHGEVDDAETEYLVKTLGELNLFKYLDQEHCLTHFGDYVDQLQQGALGEETLLKELDDVAPQPDRAELIYGVCTGLIKTHTVPRNEEIAVLEKIQHRLGVSQPTSSA